MKHLLTATALTLSALAAADDTARTISGPGTYVFLGLGLAAPLLRDGGLGGDRFWRTADALGSSLLAAELLKVTIHARRPDGSGNDSFPSGHTTLAFTVAAMEARFHPKEAPFWYAGATLIGYSRIQLRKHNLTDVLAGAALGFGMAQFELGLPHGIFLHSQIGRGGSELTLSGRF